MDKDNLKIILKEKIRVLSKKKNIVTIGIISLSLISPFIIYYILQINLNTTLPLVVVISPSMKPSLNEGDLLFIRGIDPAYIKNGTSEQKNGDIIVYNAFGLWEGAPSVPIVHRVVNKWYNNSQNKWFFYTKGDVNFHIDYAPIPEDRIIGVVIGKIPYIGWIKISLIDYGLIYPLIIIVIALISYDLIKNSKKKDEQTKFNEDTKKNSINTRRDQKNG